MKRLNLRHIGLLCFLTVITGVSPHAAATEIWPELKQMLFKESVILPAKGELTLSAPYRAKDDRRVPIGVAINLAPSIHIKKLTIIIDDNPMPVSAVFDLGQKKSSMKITMPMRLNGPSKVRAIVETSDGKIFMTEKFVKTSGLGACAAPPIGDPKELMANLGRMELRDLGSQAKQKVTSITRLAHLKIKHPNLTGLQMDQITLRYILARFVKEVKIKQGERELFRLTSGISLSENPEITFDYQITNGNEMTVTATDTEKAVFQKTFALGLGS